jgi:hypothetical protein
MSSNALSAGLHAAGDRTVRLAAGCSNVEYCLHDVQRYVCNFINRFRRRLKIRHFGISYPSGRCHFITTFSCTCRCIGDYVNSRQ